MAQRQQVGELVAVRKAKPLRVRADLILHRRGQPVEGPPVLDELDGLGDLREGGIRMRLYKRNKVWWCSYYDDGVRRQTSTHCQDKNAGEEIARQLVRDASNPALSAANKATLSGALSLLLADREEQARSAGSRPIPSSFTGRSAATSSGCSR